MLQPEATEDSVWYEQASAGLLAAEPAEFEKPEDQPMSGWQEMRSHLEQRMAALETWRLTWWQHWASIAQYILPRRYHWFITANTMNRGTPLNDSIVDPTGTQAMRICAAGVMSDMTSPSRPWFKLKPRQSQVSLDQAGQMWFDEVESRLYEVMAHSNFYDAVAQMDEDLVTFGTAPMLIYEDAKEIIRCYNPCAGEYFLAVGSNLRVETFNRKFVLTISQIVEMFGLENCPADIQSMWKTKGGSIETERVVAHAIEPNFPLASRGGAPDIDLLKGDFSYREVYWIHGASANKPLSLRGFEDIPFIAPRWAVTSNDAYGRSPAMDTLPDVAQLQMMTKRQAEAIEKQVRPPMVAGPEMKNMPSSTLPGHVTFVAKTDGLFKPAFEVKPDIVAMTANIKEVQDRIKRGFFNDLFLMIAQSTKDMTAYEVAQRQQEKLQVLGPVVERLQNEALSPLIMRVYKIMARKGLLPPVPKSLQGMPIQIEYISMLALAQRAAITTGIERLEAMLGRVAAVNPEILDGVDQDEMLREYANATLVPAKIMKPAELVAKTRMMRAKAAQQQQQAAQAAQLTMAGVQGAQTLSQTDVGGGANALQMMLGSQGGGGASAGVPTTKLRGLAA